jgi:plasmid stabilization system protein ParE
MSRYVINILASRDLREIADYFAENGVEAGERFLMNLTVSSNSFLLFPRAAKATQRFAQIFEDYLWKVVSFSIGCYETVALRFYEL